MTIIRTPDERFLNLPGFPYAPNYVQIGDTRMHYVEEGSGPVVLLLHGEPTWSYLYRHMIPPLSKNQRVVAPDLVGFGRSDKYASPADYSYDMHCAKFAEFVRALDLREITLAVHDWGGPIGLRVATEMPERFSRLVVLNTFLSTGQAPPNRAFHLWQAFSRYSPVFPVGWLIQIGTVGWLPRGVRRAYDAPFANRTAKAGARIMPQRVPVGKDDAAIPAMRATFRALRRWDKPAIVMFSDTDPILGGLDSIFRRLIPPAQQQPLVTIDKAGHFLQEDQGALIARHILAFIARTQVINGPDH